MVFNKNEYMKDYHQKNKEKRNKYNKKWILEHIKWAKKYRKEYNKTEKGRIIKRKGLRKYRLNKKLLKEVFTIDEWNKKLDTTNGICPECGKFIGKDKLTIDHNPAISIAPIGFIYTIYDVHPLCRSCNSKKGNKFINGGKVK